MGFLSNSPAITSFQLQLTNSLSGGRFSQSLFLFCLSFWNSYFFVFIFSCAYCKILFWFLYFRFVLLFFFWFANIVCSRYLYLCIIYVISGNHTDLFSHPIVVFFSDLFCCRFAICKTMVCFQFDALKSCSFGCVFGCLKRISKVSIIVLGCVNKSHFVVLGCCFCFTQLVG